MDWPTLLTILGIAFTASWTPGPNNALLASSGANFGIRRTVPHALGVTLGFPIMIFATALGLGSMIQTVPYAETVMRWAGAAVLLWFAWRVATASTLQKGALRSRPFSFVEAAGFQWINPKAWALALGLSSQFFVPERPVQGAVTLALVFLVSGLGSSFFWTGLGQALQRVLHTPERMRAFNVVMGLCLAMFVIVLLWDEF